MADTTERSTAGNERGLHRDGAKPAMAKYFDFGLLLKAGEVWALNNLPTDDYPEGKYPDKDGRPNFQSGIATTKLLDSCLRHLIALMQGRDTDDESGLDHAAHLLCCLSMFHWMRQNRVDLDDRPSPYIYESIPGFDSLYVKKVRDRVGKWMGVETQAEPESVVEELIAAAEAMGRGSP